jgi:translation initiation factor 2 subunit 3
MFSQPLINIGMIGHVSDGKSTLTKSLSGIVTQRFSKEKESNITIRLGYANALIYKCKTCEEPKCYYSVGTNNKDPTLKLCRHCETEGDIVNHVSFVDCPGHNSFMGTMLNGTSVMDYTITVESAVNKTFPAPQTIQHLNAIESNNIQNVAFILNKIDLVPESTTCTKLEELEEFKQNYKCKNAPLIPVSAAFDINVDVVCEILAKLKAPKRELESEKLRMNVIRSFNINLPGTQIEELKGGVVGGSIVKGMINIDDEIYIYPGIIYEDSYEPLKAKVHSLFSEKTPLTSAISGGLIGIGLDIDPGLTGDDALVGNVIKKKSKLENEYVTKNLTLKVKLYDNYQVENSNNDNFILNINTNNLIGVLKDIVDDLFVFEIEKAIYIEQDDKITLSVKNMEGMQVIGFGIFHDCIGLTQIS